jgi:hypothetical protein
MLDEEANLLAVIMNLYQVVFTVLSHTLHQYVLQSGVKTVIRTREIMPDVSLYSACFRYDY